MTSSSARSARNMELLSKLMFQGYGSDPSTPKTNLEVLQSELDEIFAMSEERFGELLKLADTHHVTMRALNVVEIAASKQGKVQVQQWCEQALRAETIRITNAVEWLASDCGRPAGFRLPGLGHQIARSLARSGLRS